MDSTASSGKEVRAGTGEIVTSHRSSDVTGFKYLGLGQHGFKQLGSVSCLLFVYFQIYVKKIEKIVLN